MIVNALAALALTLAVVPLLARAAPYIEPGLWQQTIQIHQPDGKRAPPRSATRCLGEADVADMREALIQNQPPDCTVSDYDMDGNRITWTVHCQGQTNSVTQGVLKRQSAHAYTIGMDIVTDLDGTPRTSRVRGEAKRVGACENG